eukprot:jgi/Astpho2/8178/Aster-03106
MDEEQEVLQEPGYEDGPVGTRHTVAATSKVSSRWLLSNAAAGSIIGRGGATISEFQEQSSARIQLSRTNDFFPGTSDRIMLVAGPVNQVLTALHLIVGKIRGEPNVSDSLQTKDGKAMQLRLLVHSQLCGSILGKAGATIKSFAEDSRAQITVSPQDRIPRGATDRIVRIAGELEQIMRAVALILSRLAENPNYSKFTSNSVSIGGGLTLPSQRGAAREPGAEGPAPALNGGALLLSGLQGAGPLAPGVAGPSGGVGPPLSLQAPAAVAPTLAGTMKHLGGNQTELSIAVPDNKVGAIIGKGGQVITELKSCLSVEIRISDKHDLLPGTNDRKVTITGPADMVPIAQTVILKKISQSSESQ